ncbi:Mth938-like domain-containing protein [Luteimonas sp. SX5]|uniref:Mth938-like domain-containing protein n=1 Tax=Luteimonas galliterrae TaxID=2940486 RepID=A0ABT0MIQ8_9GAMM|nr:Mth938-like domain-containing protein [Luteimonas galliterrae]MCL1634165.1 Mth938-like domain-containing protein [Luteimonas galliterrae]
MQLNFERPDYEFSLRGADGSHALVNDRTLTRSFIVAPDQLVEDWPARDVAALAPGDLEPLLALQPEVVLLGTGATQAFPPAQTAAACLSRGIGLEAMTNSAAARTFNVLAAEGRRVVAGFLIG